MGEIKGGFIRNGVSAFVIFFGVGKVGIDGCIYPGCFTLVGKGEEGGGGVSSENREYDVRRYAAVTQYQL